MAETPVVCCPICTKPLAYENRMQQHLLHEHGNKQMSYDLLEDAPLNFIIMNRWGRIYQKDNNTEQCWISPGSVAKFSTWQLIHGEQPLFRVVGESNG